MFCCVYLGSTVYMQDHAEHRDGGKQKAPSWQPACARPVPGGREPGSQELPHGDKLTEDKLARVGVEVYACLCELCRNHSHHMGCASHPHNVSG